MFIIHQPVDRILRQKGEREGREKAIGALLISNAPEIAVQKTQTDIPTTQPKIPSLNMPLPSPNIPELECLPPKPELPRDSISPLSNIGIFSIID